ncbi:uncharacterized protein WM294_008617 [Sarcoramphus papa]
MGKRGLGSECIPTAQPHHAASLGSGASQPASTWGEQTAGDRQHLRARGVEECQKAERNPRKTWILASSRNLHTEGFTAFPCQTEDSDPLTLWSLQQQAAAPLQQEPAWPWLVHPKPVRDPGSRGAARQPGSVGSAAAGRGSKHLPAPRGMAYSPWCGKVKDQGQKTRSLLKVSSLPGDQL